MVPYPPTRVRTLVALGCLALLSLALISCEDNDDRIFGDEFSNETAWIKSVTPMPGAQNVSTDAVITVHFSDSMHPASINRSTFRIDGGSVPCSVRTDGNSARLFPLEDLAQGTLHTVTLHEYITDASANRVDGDYTWVFETAGTAAPDSSVGLRPFRSGTLVRIERDENYISVYLDSTAMPTHEFGGYDLLLEYDASAFRFTGAQPGKLMVDCGWEYFTYGTGADADCGGEPCPERTIRLKAIADIDNGSDHPDCYICDSTKAPGGELAQLLFVANNPVAYDGEYVPIRFVWYDCGDNVLYSKSGDTLYGSRFIYGPEDVGAVTNIAADEPFPSYLGANSTCWTWDSGRKTLVRTVDFASGGVEILPEDSGEIGDLNLNDLPYEIADVVLFSNYLVYGMQALNIDPELQAAVSDINGDGYVLTPADMIALIDIIRGDADPHGFAGPPFGAMAEVELDDRTVSLRSAPDTEIGALLLIARGDVTPELLVSRSLEMKHDFDGANTHILVYSMYGEVISNGQTTQLLRFDTETELVYIDASDDQGRQMMTVLQAAGR